MSSLYEDPCGYFPGKKAHALMYRLSPPDTQQLDLFDKLLAHGFRRSGDIVYCEVCPDCKKCIPIRIIAPDFSFSKNQRHLLRKNSDVELTITDNAADFVTTEKAALMMAYDKRHAPEKEETLAEVKETLEYMNGIKFDEQTGVDSKLYAGTINMEYRLNGKLIGCSIVDTTSQSISSNYFYYDISSEVMKRSIGTYSILKEIEYCKQHSLRYYYLGYWIADCRKMSYKANFKPHELLVDGSWSVHSSSMISDFS